MVIARLQGGLGNQMFQYAAGKALAYRLKTKLYLDTSWYKVKHTNTQRNYELPVFSIPDRLMTWKQRNRFGISKMIYRVSPRLSQAVGYWFKEQSLAFDPRFEKIKGDMLLVGYFASEQYFLKIEKTIRLSYTFPQKMSVPVSALITKMKQQPSVAVHFRRGDYATDKKTNAYHGLMPLAYYKEAMMHISRQVQEPVFYYFSDDTQWLKQQMPETDNHRIIDLPDEPDWVQMMLMKHCQHNIIANSTFSWWGAWLNANPNKIVVAPKLWFADPQKESPDLIPSTWMRL